MIFIMSKTQNMIELVTMYSILIVPLFLSRLSTRPLVKKLTRPCGKKKKKLCTRFSFLNYLRLAVTGWRRTDLRVWPHHLWPDTSSLI